MTLNKKYWASIAERITTDFQNGHPANWKKPDIDTFLEYFLLKLKEICRQDQEKAKRCGVPYIKDEFQYNQLRLTYDGFRRLFITKDRNGSPKTKEMFAIYFGYDSYNDYLIKNDIRGEESLEALPVKAAPENNVPTAVKKPSEIWSKIKRFSIALLLLATAIILLRSVFSTSPGHKAFIIFRHDNGITIIDTRDKKPIQIRAESKVTGMDIDMDERLIFWSSYPFDHISKGKLSENFDGLEPGYTIFNLIDSIPGPAGIVVNPKEKVIYCAMYRDSTIAMYDYNGQLLKRNLIKGLKGRPSSVELDVKNKILYWTDVSNGKIGKFNLDTKITDHNFIDNAGYYPDGTSIDTINNVLYWTNRYDCQIGWTSLSNPNPSFAAFDWLTASVEVDAEKSTIYCSVGNSDIIMEGFITESGIDFNNASKYFETGGHEPSVLKLIKFKGSNPFSQ